MVVPVYKSAETIDSLVGQICDALDSLSYAYEVILVNDGSPDRSGQAITACEKKYSKLRGIHLLRNFGQHNALLCGIRAARFEYTVTLDDDLQNPPEEIGKLLSELRKGYGVVYGIPDKQRHGVLRNCASIITKLALRGVSGREVARSASTFRAFRTHLRTAFSDYRGAFVNIDVLLSWGALSCSTVTVRHDKRLAGESNYSIRMLFRHAMNMATGFSAVPLKIATACGFVTLVFGVGVLAYVLSRYLINGSSVAGFPFLASIITIFSGSQLFLLGIMGEYIARMHFRMMDCPSYVVDYENNAS